MLVDLLFSNYVIDIRNYSPQVKLFVTKLTSTKTQIPYDYYSLPFCKPKHEKKESENLGEELSGDKIENSVYKVHCQHIPLLNLYLI